MIDWDLVEFIAMTRLGYSMRDTEHAYFGEIFDKFELYKVFFNREKRFMYEQTGEKQEEVFDSLKDF